MSAGDWKEFFKAADEGNLSLVQFHTENGININYQHPEVLMTALVAAIKNNHTDVVIYLLNHGADPRLESYYDRLTPLAAALKYKNALVLEKLKAMGVKKPWYKIF